MNLNQLHYFVTLAHMEHFTKASKKLLITQPTLSHAISALEEELGISLFERQGRNVVLTKYGRFFLEYVEDSLKILDTGIRKTMAMTSQDSGRIDMGYIYTQGSQFVPEVVADFLQRNEGKKIEFGFHNGITEEIIRGVREERYDVGFCSMVEGQNDLEFFAVAQEKLIAIVPREHPLADKKSVQVKEVLSYPQIAFNPGSGLRKVVDKICAGEKLKPKIVYCVDEDTALAGLVAKGFGVGIVPDVPAIRSMPVCPLELEEVKGQRLIYMVIQKDKYRLPIVQRFVDYIKEYYVKPFKIRG